MIYLLAAAIIACTAPANAGCNTAISSVASAMTTRVDGYIKIDAAGNLTDYRIDTQLPEQLRELVSKTVHKWAFFPVLVGGQAVPAEAKMRITLAGRVDGDDLVVTVDNVIFLGGPGTAIDPSSRPVFVTLNDKGVRLPAYPESLLREGVQGTVLLYLKLGIDGRVQEICPIQVSLIDVKGNNAILAKAAELFASSAVDQVKNWRFGVTTRISNPSPDELTVGLPVAFRLTGFKNPKPGQWHTEVRSEKKAAPWLMLDPTEQAFGVSDVDNGEIVPLASSIRLATKVNGEAL